MASRDGTEGESNLCAMGYEDCNDANDLRDDPMLKMVCDRRPESEGGLSSQPTLSRFENAATGKALRALRERFEQSYVDALPSDTVSAIAGTGAIGNSADGVPAISNPLNYPCASENATGAVFIAEYEGCRVRTIDDAGGYVTVAGTASGSNFFGDNGPATAAGLFYPSSTAFDPFTDTLYIADTYNHRIRLVR